MNNMAVLDTGFLISMVDRNRPFHQAARSYYKYFLEHSVVMLLPTVVAAEFSVVQQAQLLITEDETTLCKYCERLKTDGKIEFHVVKLSGGFDEAQVNEDGQRGLLSDH